MTIPNATNTSAVGYTMKPHAFPLTIDALHARNAPSASLLASHAPANGSSMTLSVRPAMAITAGETFSVALPSFIGPPSCIEGAPPFPRSGIKRAAWDGATLTLTVGQGGLAAGAAGVFAVPYAAGILPPAAGLPANSRNLTIKTDAVAGPVLPTVLSSPAVAGTGYEPEVAAPAPVGGFTGNLSLSFEPAKAGAATSITLRFTPTMQMGEYESVAVYLPDFSGPELEGVGEVGGATGARFTASWSQLCPARTLTFTLAAGQAVAAGEAVEVAVKPQPLNLEPPRRTPTPLVSCAVLLWSERLTQRGIHQPGSATDPGSA